MSAMIAVLSALHFWGVLLWAMLVPLVLAWMLVYGLLVMQQAEHRIVNHDRGPR